MSPTIPPIDRRAFLGTTGTLLAARSLPAAPPAVERPAVTDPRATAGDAVEPQWDERFTVSVGTKTGSMMGSDQRVIQAAVDMVARMGGGTVRLGPGTYRFRNSVYLASNVRLIGSGADTIIIKEPSIKTKLVVDSDWYDQEITLADGAGFRVGDGVCLRARNPHNAGSTVIKRTLVARSGNRFKLDRALRENLWLMGEASCASLFPLFSGEFVSNIAIESMVIDGNRAHNENLDGNYAGCIFLQDCSNIQIRQVEARNNNGDGISWQICHDVTVEQCHSHDHAGLGLHPGSGSQRPIMRDNRLAGNDIGLFFCWGVKHGLAEKNKLEGNRVGISVGHRDTDNLIRDNDVANSSAVGVLFRPERGKAFAGHRNRVEKNRITNSGGDAGIAIDVQGETEHLVITGNTIRESRGPAQRIGIKLGPKTGPMTIEDNTIEGMTTKVMDQRERK